ncbi:uncharacterized protein LOC129755181 [Uranotaenia lowii]|uniref:uncharacterized protein LOC129755181 n=1 Tax=Uranotaenia lowii TaxID=190385 RepID=UPI00247A2D82|nr:uncharacterized protein LOC129755181 [Uranotaenia lowii]
MSSIMPNDKVLGGESRSKMFLRSNSFQKLCSLAHPMRLRGFKSNREALKSVFESLIVTTRGVIQTVTYRILCFLVLTPFTRLVTRPAIARLVDRDGNFRTLRLILKLTLSMIISTDKESEAKLEEELQHDASLNTDFTDNRTTHDCNTETQTQDSRLVDTAVQTEDPPTPPEQFFDCKEPEATPAQQKAPRHGWELQRLGSRFPEDPAARNRQRKKNGRRRERYFSSLALVVYGALMLFVGQLSALAYLLNVATVIPAGMVFLILAVGYMGFVLMRILFQESRKADPSRQKTSPQFATTTTTTTTTTVAVVPKVATKVPKTKGLHPILVAIGKQLASIGQQSNRGSAGRMSRISNVPSSPGSRSPRLLCDDSKTISKMKIL